MIQTDPTSRVETWYSIHWILWFWYRNGTLYLFVTLFSSQICFCKGATWQTTGGVVTKLLWLLQSKICLLFNSSHSFRQRTETQTLRRHLLGIFLCSYLFSIYSLVPFHPLVVVKCSLIFRWSHEHEDQ